MFAPHTVTLYNAVRNRSFDALPALSITVLNGVFLDMGLSKSAWGRKSDLNQTGLDIQEDAALFIPFSCSAVNALTGQPQTFVTPEAFDLLDDHSQVWTAGLRGQGSGTDCFFVKNRVVLPDASFLTLCQNFHGVFRVSSVLVRDFGSPSMRHWKVGGCAGS